MKSETSPAVRSVEPAASNSRSRWPPAAKTMSAMALLLHIAFLKESMNFRARRHYRRPTERTPGAALAVAAVSPNGMTINRLSLKVFRNVHERYNDRL
jgi:hypothetical protein